MALSPKRRRAGAPDASDGDRKSFARRVISLDAFRDPNQRVRMVVWYGAAALVIIAFTIVALGATSGTWFCANGCHKVQDDTITAYRHSSHAQISCMACHMPVGASPGTFLLHKAEALGELYLTVTNQFELPLNGESEVSLEMSAKQCTQCHTENRKVTPSSAVIIDHKKHEKAEVNCTVCHNRVAHREDFELTLADPKSKQPNRAHENFMRMSACFRCHSQTAGGRAPGRCSACHPSTFELVPAFHKRKGFFPFRHGKLALAERERVAEAEKSETAEAKAEESAQGASGVEVAMASEPAHEIELPRVSTVNLCFTCHNEKFCSDCHGGVIMPHPVGFKKRHPETGKKNPQACTRCHGSADTFCDACHHGRALGVAYDAKKSWRAEQHPKIASQVGPSACQERCHEVTYCARCHVRGGNPEPE